MPQRIAMIGECMLELTRQSPGQSSRSLPMNLSYGGDTLNSAVYLARQGVAVDYVTALGDDPMSDWLIAQWREEGVGCDLVARHPDAVPGLYLVETDGQGERSFYYWRDSAPARRLLDDADSARKLFAQLADYDWLCLSGISLAIYSASSRESLFSLLEDYRSQGGKVVFDGNYRPKLWPDSAITRNAYERMYRLTDIALPTIEDEQAIFGDPDAQSVVQRLKSMGIDEIVLKMGEQGCLVVADGNSTLVPAKSVRVVDTTSAGDSFNAGYLASRMGGKPAPVAAQGGHALASIVIQHPGAIIPPAAMPAAS